VCESAACALTACCLLLAAHTHMHYRNSEMVSGTLAKKTLGDGSKTGLFYTLIREHGPAEAARYVSC
jgi:hypothetical protein